PLGVAPGELRHLPPHEGLVGAEQQVAAVGERREGGRVARQQLEAVPLQFEIPDDLRAQQAVHIGGRGHFKPRPQLFRDAGAAHHLAALKHQHPPPRPGEVGRGHETVVAGADDDDVVAQGRRCSRSSRPPISGGTCSPNTSFIGAVTTKARAPPAPWAPAGPPVPPGAPLPPLPPGAPGCAGQPAAPAAPSVPATPDTPAPPRPPRVSISSQSAGGTTLASAST